MNLQHLIPLSTAVIAGLSYGEGIISGQDGREYTVANAVWGYNIGPITESLSFKANILILLHLNVSVLFITHPQSGVKDIVISLF